MFPWVLIKYRKEYPYTITSVPKNVLCNPACREVREAIVRIFWVLLSLASYPLRLVGYTILQHLCSLLWVQVLNLVDILVLPLKLWLELVQRVSSLVCTLCFNLGWSLLTLVLDWLYFFYLVIFFSVYLFGNLFWFLLL